MLAFLFVENLLKLLRSSDRFTIYSTDAALWHGVNQREYVHECEPLCVYVAHQLLLYDELSVFRSKMLCFGGDCFRIELAVAIQMCCEHDTRSFRFRPKFRFQKIQKIPVN